MFAYGITSGIHSYVLSAVRSITARTPGANRSTVYRVRLCTSNSFSPSHDNGFRTFVWRAVGLPGDFNNNGVVDAADYVLWRDHLGDASEAAFNGNGDGINGIDAGDFHGGGHTSNTTAVAAPYLALLSQNRLWLFAQTAVSAFERANDVYLFAGKSR